MKTCFKCNRLMPLSSFYVHAQMLDGHLNKCKDCTKKDVAIRYLVKREDIRRYESMRSRSAHRRAKALEYQRRTRMQNPEKYKARQLIGKAIRNGTLQRMPCEICGSLFTEAHHEDYSKPLDIRWFCFEHHREVGHGQKVGN